MQKAFFFNPEHFLKYLGILVRDKFFQNILKGLKTGFY